MQKKYKNKRNSQLKKNKSDINSENAKKTDYSHLNIEEMECNIMYGTLNDEEIIRLAKKQQLIVEGFQEQNVKQACYELRAGNIYYELDSKANFKHVDDGDVILIKPNQRIVIITKEKLNIPHDVLGRVLTKGSLFTLGIIPINTYADPGFEGALGIIMQNFSNNYLKIKSGDKIAKIEFDRLLKPVKRTYQGQHGYDTGVWPFKDECIISNKKELNTYLNNFDDIDIIRDSFGDSVADIISRIIISERRFLMVSIIYIIMMLIFIAVISGTDWISPVKGALMGVFSNIIYGFFNFFVYRKKNNV